MAGRRVLYGLALLGGLIFYGAYQEWFSWILLWTLLLLPWLSLVLSLRAIMHTKPELSAAARIPVGSTEIIQMQVSAKEIQPPIKSKICITKPLTGEKRILRSGEKLPTNHCGGIIAQLYKPRIFDYLGLFRFRIRKTEPQTFFVWPQARKMEIPSDLTQYLARSWRPKSGGGYSENHEIRQYRPGDNLNQMHWKLSAKVGEWMLREPMEPEKGQLVLTMDLCGTPETLDEKFGRFLWLSNWMLENQLPFEIRVLTGNGMEGWFVTDEWSLRKCMEALLCSPVAREGSIRDRHFTAWQYHIGGEADEA